MADVLSIGVLGAGHLGSIHLRLLSELPCFSLRGFFDTDAARAASVEKETGIHLFSSMDELIDSVDVVDIVTPTTSHYECARKAVSKSRHCFIEKPVTSTLKEAKALRKLVADKKVLIQVGHVERFNPAFVAAQPYCDEPKFMEVHRLAEFNPRGTDVSVVYDLMIHDIDLVMHLCPHPVRNISASGVAVISSSPDIANVRMEFENACVANLTASRISMKNMRKMRLFQKDAYISMDFLSKEVEIIRMQTMTENDRNDPFAIVIDPGGHAPKKRIFFERPETDRNANAIRDELKAFAEAIKRNSRPAITLGDAIHALQIANMIAGQIN